MRTQLIDEEENRIIGLRVAFLITTAETHILVKVVIAYIFPCISLHAE